jgi:hypothetical protein
VRRKLRLASINMEEEITNECDRLGTYLREQKNICISYTSIKMGNAEDGDTVT